MSVKTSVLIGTADFSIRRCVEAILREEFSPDTYPHDDPCRLADCVGACLEIPWKSDSVLPRHIILPPLLVAALFTAVENKTVQIDQLRDVLSELLPPFPPTSLPIEMLS